VSHRTVRHCKALLWYEERIRPNKHTKNTSFGICCNNEKISLPAKPEPPAFLQELLGVDNQISKNYMKNIRSYNSMFAFTFTGGVVDKEINKGHRPYVFRMHDQNYHHIGSLILEEGSKPRWAQLYIYDTEHEVENRISASKGDGDNSTIDPTIVAGLQKMLDEHNILAKMFRMARDRFTEDDYHEYTLKLISKREKSGTHDLLSASEVAALVVRDPNEGSAIRDIIVDFKDMGPQRISDIHPKLMALEYPLLFPFGEDGFTLQILYRCEHGKNYKRKNVTMLEYNEYYLFQCLDESMLLLTSGRLSMQYWVDVYMCLEQNRLNWIRQNQGKLRTELYSGLQDALDRGDVNTDKVGRRVYLPSSHT
jgi:hypothetical protein